VEDLSDIERAELLRSWWSQNWLWIVGGIALGLAILGGWRYWQNYQQSSAEFDSTEYRAVLDALDKNQRDVAEKHAKQIRTEHPASPYGDQADLALARAAVERRDFDEAARRLKVVADGSKDAELRQVARSRLARVLVEQGKHDEAIALLDPAKAGAFAAHFHDIRGDAYAAKGDAAAARREYGSALTALTDDSGMDRGFIELKRDALPGAAVSAAPAAATAASTGAPTK
jgi:predicted negative regulator of RcsB-dependent stress response